MAVYLASSQQCTSGITPAMVEEDESLKDCFCYNLGTARSTESNNVYGIDCSSSLTSYLLPRGLSILSVVTIVVVNFVLKSIIKTLTQFEKHHSLTRQQESITNKLFVGLFLNTAIVLLVVNMQFQHYVARVGFNLRFNGVYEGEKNCQLIVKG